MSDLFVENPSNISCKARLYIVLIYIWNWKELLLPKTELMTFDELYKLCV